MATKPIPAKSSRKVMNEPSSRKTSPKRFSSMADLLKDSLPENPEFVAAFEQQVQRRELVRHLALLRNQNNISQADVAKYLGCKQSKISKLENGYDDDVTLAEIKAYAKAMNCDVDLIFRSQNLTIADEVKRCAFRMKRYFDRRTDLAQHDEEIAKGVANFHIEALMNLVEIIRRSVQKLPQKSRTAEQHIRFEVDDSSDPSCNQQELDELARI
ncbi:hypothetical protein BH10PLA2_BH10PLA2_39400 [soil metagenome]